MDSTMIQDGDDRNRISELSKKGYRFLKATQIDSAIECFVRILEIQPENPYALVGMGDALRKSDRHKEAIPQYQNCLKSNPENSYALFGLADCYKSLGDANSAIEVWEAYLQQDSRNVAVLTRLGDAYRKVRNYKKSKSMYEKVLRVSESNPFAMIGLGHLHYDFNEYREALAYWDKMEKLAGKRVDIRVLTSMGNCYRKLKRYNDSIVYFGKALKIQPDNFYALYGMGDCYRGLEKPNLSLDYWNRIIENDPNNKVILTRVADAYRNLNEIDRAEIIYKKAMDIEYDLYAQLGLGLVAKARGKFQEAADIIEKLIEEDPNNYRLYVETAECYEQLGKIDEALTVLRRQLATGNQNDLVRAYADRLQTQA